MIRKSLIRLPRNELAYRRVVLRYSQRMYSTALLAWPIQLMAEYQYPTGMIVWGIRDCPSL